VNILDHPLGRVFGATLAAMDPANAVVRALGSEQARELRDGRPVWLAAVGKAACAMASGAATALGAHLAGGLVVAPSARPVPTHLTLLLSDHPVPGTRSFAAGQALLTLASAVPADHHLLAAVSGGASSLAAVPGTGVTFAEKVAKVQEAAASGAPIAELNRIRTSLSAIKGGRLAARCLAPVVTVVISDVVGDDPAVVGSGPTVGPAAAGRTFDRVIVASGIRDMAVTAATCVRDVLGIVRTDVVDSQITGDVDLVAEQIAASIEVAARESEPIALVWTGEPTIRLGPEVGRGGRARHLALRVAWHLRGRAGWTLLSAGTDGVDGTADGTGAIVDGTTVANVEAAGIDPCAALAAFDSGTALGAAGAMFSTGPTGINHADLMVAVIMPSVL
jgi:hydroxypyruvate reductase